MTDTMNNLNNLEDNTPRTQLKKLGRKKKSTCSKLSSLFFIGVALPQNGRERKGGRRGEGRKK